MPIDRGPEWYPSDGRPDQRPVVKCSSCGIFANCYRGKLLRTVTNERGTWQMFEWICSTCMSAMVGEALREADA